MKTLWIAASLLPLSVLAPDARAQLHDGDIVVRVVRDHLAVGAEREDGQVDFHVRVFGAAFGEQFADFTNEPGLDSGEGALPPGSEVGFTIRRALRLWDGARFPSGLEGVPAERIQVRLGPLGPVATPPDDTPVVGFAMTVSALGELHQHPGYTLLAPAGPGLYLYECELWSSEEPIGVSRPFWIVFRQLGSSEEQERAMEWVRTHLACPADFNADGQVDFFDYLDFAGAFAAEETAADFNADGQLDFFDYLDFVGAFAECE
jgi:hypothetical protein